MKVTVYEYPKCTTCKNALAFLDKKKVSYTKKHIVETPPTLKDLKAMVGFLEAQGKTFKALFNTSGIQYRELKISEKIASGMSESEALKLLSGNGMLVKRPFVLTEDFGTVGFKEDQWKKLF